MTELQPIAGSFRDPAARVYASGDHIFRGVDAVTLANFQELKETEFFRREARRGRIIGTRVLNKSDPRAAAVIAQGWAGVLEHDRLPLLSYPYEWTFSMLKDAAILHLELLEEAIMAGWIIKDSTPYNIQFVGSSPLFIDTPSFVPRPPGDYWRAYRQFCMLFLYPLMVTAYRGISFQPILRGSLDGIPPAQAAGFFTGLSRFKKGVLTQVWFPAAMERRLETVRCGGAAANKRKLQSDAMVLGLVQSMQRIVAALKTGSSSSLWANYTQTHSYDDNSLDEKRSLVANLAIADRYGIVWDLGCNTGTFSELLKQRADYVLSVDGDQECVDRFYQRLRARGDNQVLPLFMNLADPSPSQGWANAERAAFDKRNKPDLILALALIHHICLSNNIPIPAFLDWLQGTGANLIIEFVTRDDDMVKAMLARKSEAYKAYDLLSFEQELHRRYEVKSSAVLKEGARKIYYCKPRS